MKTVKYAFLLLFGMMFINYYFAPTLTSVRTVRVSTEYSVGTGSIINDHQILTNKHVMQGDFVATVSTKDGIVRHAYLDYEDPILDIAVLSISDDFKFDKSRQVSLSCSVPYIVGSEYYTVGHTRDDPRWAYTNFNYTGAQFSASILPEIGNNALMFDSASTNTGNSGGGVFDVFGNHVGVVTAIYLNVPREEGDTGPAIGLNYNIAISNKDVCLALKNAGIDFNRSFNQNDIFSWVDSFIRTTFYSIDQRIR